MYLVRKIFILLFIVFILYGCSTFHTGEVSPNFHTPKNSYILIKNNPQLQCSSPIEREKIASYFKQNLQQRFPNNQIEIVDWQFQPLYLDNFYVLMFSCNTTKTNHQGIMPVYSPTTTTTTGFVGNTAFSGVSTGGTTSYVNYNYTNHNKLISVTYNRWYKKNGKWNWEMLWSGAVGDDISSFDKNPKKYIDLVMSKFGQDYQP